MIISRTPLRISFVGGGSDLPSYYQRSKGAVLSTSINKYIYISLHPYFNVSKSLLKYSKTEEIDDLEDISNPLIRLSALYSGIGKGFEFTSSADVPSGTGLGSSSSFTVGALNVFHTYQSKLINERQLAEMACKIEINDLKSPIGKQDQYAASFGGLNIFEFGKNGEVTKIPVQISEDNIKHLERNLLCFYIGGSRSANEILKEQSERMSQETYFSIQSKMVSLVYDMKDILETSNLDDFGLILDKNWKLKKQLSSGISSSYIDDLYKIGLSAGASGGKLLGAGGTGFMLFYCVPSKQENLISNLSKLKQLNFKFDTEGSVIIYRD